VRYLALGRQPYLLIQISLFVEVPPPGAEATAMGHFWHSKIYTVLSVFKSSWHLSAYY